MIVRGANIRSLSGMVNSHLHTQAVLEHTELLHSGRDELVFDVAYQGRIGDLVRLLEKPVNGISLVPAQVVADEMIFDLERH